MDAMPFPPQSISRPALAWLSGAANLEAQLQLEIEAMLQHAFSSGTEVPPALMKTAAQAERGDADAPGFADALPMAALAVLHAQLAKLVSPAMPGTLHLLRIDAARNGTLHAILGPLANVRRLMVAALVCMLLFMLISLSPTIDHDAMARDIYSTHGFPLLSVLCFLLSAAGMGSTFQALFTAQAYISNATYDPRYDASYWIRIGLGLVAGLLLSVLVPVGSSASAPTVAKPVLALLGGFSAGLVYRILQRLVETVESLFQGDREVLQQREAALSRAGMQQAAVEARVDMAAQIVSLRDQVAQGASPQRLNDSLSALLDGLLQQRSDAASTARVTSAS